MKTLLAAVLLLGPLLANAQVTPPVPQPEAAPPPPTESPAPPPAFSAPEQRAVTPTAAGQWVYTVQYGWVWMPYGDAYTYVPAGGAAPDMYVYWPAYGWRWVVAPWLWGLGPHPYFGVYGWTRYGWYGRGFGHWYGFPRGGPAWAGRGSWGHGGWYGPHPGSVAPHPVVRGGGPVVARPGGFGRPGGYAGPARPGGVARPGGRFGGGVHPGGLGHR